jgi:hypothetical protein
MAWGIRFPQRIQFSNNEKNKKKKETFFSIEARNLQLKKLKGE